MFETATVFLMRDVAKQRLVTVYLGPHHQTKLLCVLQPSGKGKRLPEVHCMVSQVGCFNLFAKVRTLYPEPGLLTNHTAPG